MKFLSVFFLLFQIPVLVVGVETHLRRQHDNARAKMQSEGNNAKDQEGRDLGSIGSVIEGFDSDSETPESPSNENVTTPSDSQLPSNVTTQSGSFSAISSTGCRLHAEVTCHPPLESTSTSCTEHLIPEYSPCESSPTELLFRFNGGICNAYSQPQDASLYFCQDFGEGPDIVLNETNYIEALPPRKTGDLYFEGEVSVGDTFLAHDTDGVGGILDEEILLLVYADSSKAELLQMMVFHTKCQADLTLGDKFGSLQLMSFTNDYAGTTSMYRSVTYAVTITNKGPETVRVGHIISIEDQVAKDLLGGSEGPTLESGASESLTQELTVEMGHGRTISTSATISGRDDLLNTCVGFGVMQVMVPDEATSAP